MSAQTYVVALKRVRRGSAPADWLDQLRATEGVSVLGSSSGRARIEADTGVLEGLRAHFGAYLHIEPVVDHFPTTG